MKRTSVSFSSKGTSNTGSGVGSLVGSAVGMAVGTALAAALGAAISTGCAGCVPEPVVETYKLWKAGDLEGARKAQFTCFDLVKKLRYGADMSVFKHVLDDRGIGGGHMKAPLLDLAEDTVEPLLETLRPYYK